MPGQEDHAFPPDDYLVEFTFDGFSPQYWLWARLNMAGTIWDEGMLGNEHAPCHGYLWVTCDDLQVYWTTDCQDVNGASGNALGAEAEPLLLFPPAVYGEWRFRLWQEDDGSVVAGPVSARFTFAEDCEAEEEVEEFVPEPGSMALLASGLAGLAGYAGLRWRARS